MNPELVEKIFTKKYGKFILRDNYFDILKFIVNHRENCLYRTLDSITKVFDDSKDYKTAELISDLVDADLIYYKVYRGMYMVICPTKKGKAAIAAKMLSKVVNFKFQTNSHLSYESLDTILKMGANGDSYKEAICDYDEKEIHNYLDGMSFSGNFLYFLFGKDVSREYDGSIEVLQDVISSIIWGEGK